MDNEFGIEFIDESEVEFVRPGRKKKTPSLFDTPISERTYWGNDKGTALIKSLARNAIRRSVRDRVYYDVNDEDLTRVLSREDRNELIEYQIDLIKKEGN